MTVLLALVLDAVFGEPKWLWSRAPHPAVLMGKAVGYIDKTYNQGNRRKKAGILSFSLLVVSAAAIGIILSLVPGIWVDVIVGAMLLAHKSLIEHVAAVGSGLRMSLAQGRRAVAMIVSRDTRDMDETAVARSAIESGAENFSDGVIAPLFWFALLGLPGLLVYKITNTADSMIGYKTDRHREFGWAAARFDDLFNWVPARITAALIWLTDGKTQIAKLAADADLHRSPNAGWPEAAMAYKLNIALAGPRSYDGRMTDFSYVNTAGKRQLGAKDIDDTTQTLWTAWWIAFGGVLVIAIL